MYIKVGKKVHHINSLGMLEMCCPRLNVSYLYMGMLCWVYYIGFYLVDLSCVPLYCFYCSDCIIRECIDEQAMNIALVLYA